MRLTIPNPSNAVGADISEPAIVYDREINNQRRRGIEVLTFGLDGLVVRALHDALA